MLTKYDFMREWIVTVKHDKGNYRFRTVAKTAKAAIDQVVAAENCPESAVIGVKLA